MKILAATTLLQRHYTRSLFYALLSRKLDLNKKYVNKIEVPVRKKGA